MAPTVDRCYDSLCCIGAHETSPAAWPATSVSPTTVSSKDQPTILGISLCGLNGLVHTSTTNTQLSAFLTFCTCYCLSSYRRNIYPSFVHNHAKAVPLFQNLTILRERQSAGHSITLHRAWAITELFAKVLSSSLPAQRLRFPTVTSSTIGRLACSRASLTCVGDRSGRCCRNHCAATGTFRGIATGTTDSTIVVGRNGFIKVDMLVKIEIDAVLDSTPQYSPAYTVP